MKTLIVTTMMLFAGAVFADDCIAVHNVRDWRVTGRNTVQVREGSRRLYNVNVPMCNQLNWADSLGFETIPRGRMMFCAGDRLHLFDISGRRLDTCMVRSISRVR